MPGRKPLNFAVQAAKAWPQGKKPCAQSSALDRDEKQQQVQASRPCAQGFALRAQGSKPCGASLDALRAEQKGLREWLFALPVKRRALPGSSEPCRDSSPRRRSSKKLRRGTHRADERGSKACPKSKEGLRIEHAGLRIEQEASRTRFAGWRRDDHPMLVGAGTCARVPYRRPPNSAACSPAAPHRERRGRPSTPARRRRASPPSSMWQPPTLMESFP
jgi:hypothetical protein